MTHRVPAFPLWGMCEYVWLEMPEGNPSWLEPEEYADALAYVLSAYGAPSGDTDLPTERTELESIRMQGPPMPGG